MSVAETEASPTNGTVDRFALLDWLDGPAFHAAFTAKAPMRALLADIPVRLIVESDAVLNGMAALAAAPDSYAIDYATRAWRPPR